MRVYQFVFLLVLIASACTSGAQNRSRVVFFRNDEAGVSSLHLFHNGRKIRSRTPQQVLFIYDNEQTGGEYIWGIKKFSTQLPEINRSFQIVELKLNLAFFMKASFTIKKVDVREFKETYSKNKWLRRRLRKAGYNSVDELTAGYNIVN